MRGRGRIFIFLALILIIGVVAVFILFQGTLLNPPAPTQAANVANIIIAGQEIPQGEQITQEMLSTIQIPPDQRSEVMFVEEQISLVVGMYARYPLEPGVVITSSMITSSRGELAESGPQWATLIPAGKVAVAIPTTRLASVGFGVADGSYANIIACMLFVDLDTEFQTDLPNQTAVLAGSGTLPDQLPFWTMGVAQEDPETTWPKGRLEMEPSIQQLFYVIPSGNQRPRLVCQTIIQNVMVLRLGNFPLDPEAWGAPAADAQQDPQAQPPEETTTGAPDIVTLVVDPQDAVSLNYLIYSGAELTLTLRSTGDDSLMDTEAIALHNLLSQYNITLPVKLPYSMEPGIYDLTPPLVDSTPQP
ncbi:MAG: SAF domain-containing protein [Chloroflexota bacterium]